jgi:hypothetical protein
MLPRDDRCICFLLVLENRTAGEVGRGEESSYFRRHEGFALERRLIPGEIEEKKAGILTDSVIGSASDGRSILPAEVERYR